MHALVVPATEPRQIEFRGDYPTPRPAPGEVLIRVHVAGICATDLEITCGYMQFAGVPGHEFVGTVVQGSPQLIGQRVVASINCACGRCEICGHGWPNHCPRRTVLGIAGRDGAFADYLTVPESNCHVLPPELPDEEAVFVEPLAAAAHVRDELPAARRLRVAQLGCGRLGMLIAQVLAQEPLDLTIFGRNPRTLGLCRHWGLPALHVDESEHRAGFDVVVECTGSPDGLRRALQLCAPRGTIILKSTYAERANVDLAPIVIHETRLIGSRCGEFRPAIELLANRRVRVAELITATFPLSDGVQALAAASQPEHIKVLLRPEPA